MLNNYTQGESDTRPWRNWSIPGVGVGYVVKEIPVNPGSVLSEDDIERYEDNYCRHNPEVSTG